MNRKELFDFMLRSIKEKSKKCRLGEPQGFIKWFIEIYFLNPQEVFVSDGSKDGKIDCFFNTNNGRNVKHYLVNAKYTSDYDRKAPVKFYEEISYFCHVVQNKDTRGEYLQKAVKPELAQRYKKLFDYYDAGTANLVFVTNHTKNDPHYKEVEELPIKIFHLDDLIQFIIDDIDIAMPRTDDLVLNDIHNVLSPDKKDTEVSTSIVFAKLYDFVKYMEDDPYDLLFARNVRLDLGNTPVNKEIKKTFESKPTEFAFSNNGITMLCERHVHNPGTKELTIVNPRVVNGSQTLHSIRTIQTPPSNARVMLRIIEIPPLSGGDLPEKISKKKDIMNKIAIRSNQQNQIKLWNLVANDDFQLELYRFFRGQGFFYERREKEYKTRSRELRSVQIYQGPSLTSMCQLICCYKWHDKKLGPAVARNLAKLFDGATYDLIKATNPELAYQLFLLDEIIYKYWKLLDSKKYISNLKNYPHQSLFSLIIKVTELSNIKWGNPDLTPILEDYYNNDSEYKNLLSFVKSCIDFIYEHYQKTKQTYLKKEKDVLSIANYFKSNLYMSSLLKQNINFPYKKYAKRLFLKV